MTSTGLPVYSTEFLLGAYGVVDSPNPFLLSAFFAPMQVFDTEKVAFDVVDRARRLAPFVSPMVEGKAMRQQGYQTRDFAPAYVKPKSVVMPNRPLKRMPGERLLGAMNPGERYLRVIQELLAEQENQITRREEWMAAQILQTGGVIIEGEDYSPVTLSYGRNSNQTIQLVGAAAWGQDGVSAMANLRAWNQLVMQSSGFNARIVVMEPAAESLFIEDTEVKEILDNRVNTPINGDFRIGNIQLAGVLTGAVGEEVKYLGDIGEFKVFVYQQTYVDDAGNVQQMLAPGTVIMGSPTGFQGTRTYGAIQDAEAGFRALARFPKMWRKEDPSVTNLMTQSAPLPVAGWPNASLAANVIG